MTDKILFFDAGPVISLVMSRLPWILPELKRKFGILALIFLRVEERAFCLIKAGELN